MVAAAPELLVLALELLLDELLPQAAITSAPAKASSSKTALLNLNMFLSSPRYPLPELISGPLDMQQLLYCIQFRKRTSTTNLRPRVAGGSIMGRTEPGW